jgi:hypothetical protein
MLSSSFQSSHKKAAVSVQGRKHFAVTCRRLSVGHEHVCRIAQGETEAFVDIGPAAVTLVSCGAGPKKQNEN